MRQFERMPKWHQPARAPVTRITEKNNSSINRSNDLVLTQNDRPHQDELAVSGRTHKMCNLPHVASRVFGTPLMIARAKLEVILQVLAPRLAGGDLATLESDVDPPSQTSITVERIAVVSVIGTLVSRSGYLDAASGLLSYASNGRIFRPLRGVGRAGECSPAEPTPLRWR